MNNLVLTINSASFLKDKEVMGKMDPICVVTCGNQKFETKMVKSGGQNPVWNETFTIPLDPNCATLNFFCWNHNTLSKNDCIGEGSINISSLHSGPLNIPLMCKGEPIGNLTCQCSIVSTGQTSMSSGIGQSSTLGMTENIGQTSYSGGMGSGLGYQQQGLQSGLGYQQQGLQSGLGYQQSGQTSGSGFGQQGYSSGQQGFSSGFQTGQQVNAPGIWIPPTMITKDQIKSFVKTVYSGITAKHSAKRLNHNEFYDAVCRVFVSLNYPPPPVNLVEQIYKDYEQRDANFVQGEKGFSKIIKNLMGLKSSKAGAGLVQQPPQTFQQY